MNTNSCLFLSKKLKRFKIGIGRPNDRSQVVDYVLNEFSPTELPLVNGTLINCVSVLLDELEINYTFSSNEYDVNGERTCDYLQSKHEKFVKQPINISEENQNDR